MKRQVFRKFVSTVLATLLIWTVLPGNLLPDHGPSGSLWAPQRAEAADGTSWGTAYPYTPPGPQASTITSYGYTWFGMPLAANRTFTLTASGATQISFYDANGSFLAVTGSSSSTYTPTVAGTYYAKILGTAGASTTLSSVDGSSFASSYSLTLSSGSGSATDTIPGNDSALFAVQLTAGVGYAISASGPSNPASLTVYDSTQAQVATATGAALTFTPSTTGTYSIRLSTGASAGSYTLSVSEQGVSQAAAIPFAAPGPQSSRISSQGYSWYAFNLAANRTFMLSSTGSTTIYYYNSSGSYLTSGANGYTPTTDGAYYAKVFGTAGASTTVSSQDGSSFAGAYNLTLSGTGGSASYTMPGNSSGLFRVQLSAGTTYSVNGTGPSTPTNMTVYDSTQTQVATATGAALTYSPPAAGTYFVRLSTGASSGSYTLNVGEAGASQSAAIPYQAPGPQSSNFSSQGYSWYMLNLAANRTFVLSSTGSTGVYYYSSSGSSLAYGSYAPSTAGPYYAKVYGTANTSTTLTSVDGSSFASAYNLALSGGSGSISNTMPANDSALHQVQLNSNTTYGITASGPSTPTGITVYDSTQTQVASATGASLSFVPATTGTYYIRLSTGASSGSYTLSIGVQGASQSSPIPYQAPGPQNSAITSQGYSWYSTNLAANRTFTLFATGASTIAYYTASGTYLTTGSYTPTSSGTYSIKVSGTANASTTLTSQDGSSFASSYGLALTSGSASGTNGAPGNDSVYYQVQLTAGKTYMASASGPSTPVGLTVYDSTQAQIATGSSTSLSFTPAAAGTYYVRVSTGASSGNYTVNVGEQGVNQSLAISYTPPGPQSSVISSQGYSWYTVNLAANRTVTIAATGASACDFYTAAGSYLASGSYTPTTAGLYYVRVRGTAGASTTITSQDGSSFASAYSTALNGGTVTVSNAVPGNDSALFALQLTANTPYVLSASGASTPAGLTVYDSTQTQVTTTSGTALNFTPTATGTYYVRLLSGANSGTYTFVAESAYLPPGPQAGTISSAGYTWYRVQLAANRTFNLTGAGAQSIYLDDSARNQLTSGFGSLRYTPSTTGTYYLQVYGPLGGAITLSSQDGSSYASAYNIAGNGGGGIATAAIPANDSALFQLQLTANTTYTLTGAGVSVPAGLTVVDSLYNQMATTTAAQLTFTPTASGTYFVRLASGGSAGNYTLSAGISYTSPGPQTLTISSAGTAYAAVQLASSRTFRLAASGVSSIYYYDTLGNPLVSNCLSPCSYGPATSGTYTVQMGGTAGASTTLTSQDGASFASAYVLDMTGGSATSSNLVPGNDSALYQLQLTGSVTYVLYAQSGPSAAAGLVVYDGTQTQVASTTTTKLLFTPQTTGTYYVRLNTGTSSGTYTLQAYVNVAQLVAGANQKAYGVFAVGGTATSGNLLNWVLSYGAGAAPTSWTVLKTSYVNSPNGDLYDWDTNTVPDGPYTLKLQTSDAIGDVVTAQVTVQVNNHPMVLNAPTTFSDTTADLSWQVPSTSDLYQFQVYKSTTSGSGFVLNSTTLVATLTDPTQRLYRVAGLSANTTYFFRVVAVYTDGHTEPSNEVTATTKVAGGTPPGDATAQVTTFGYDAVGNLIATTDPNGNTTTYTYDALNRVTAVNHPDFTQETRMYDAAGRIVASTNGVGDTTQITYDALGNTAKVTAPDGGNTTMAYDTLGRLISRTDPTGNTTSYTLDAMGRVATIKDPLANLVQFGYDANGNRTRVTDPLGNATQYGYDANNQLTQVTDPLGNSTSLGYDAVGNETTVTLALYATWTYAYNERNQLLSIKEPTGALTSLTYDSAGRVASLTNGNTKTTQYGYDSLGNLTSVTDPLTFRSVYTYDPNGNWTSMTDRTGVITTYGYDARNRLKSVQAGTLGTISFQYDGAGRRTVMNDATGMTRYTYTAGGRLQQKTTPDGKVIGYGYDLAGRLTSTTDYTGTTVGRTYDAAGRLTQVRDGDGSTTQYSYDAAGRRSQLTLPGGITVSYTYDADNHATQVSSKRADNSVVTQQSYAYDAVGRVTSRTDAATGATKYAYDQDNRLLNYQKPDGTQVSYTYDGAGNRLTETTAVPSQPSTTKNYAYDANNRLISLGSTNFSYDANGNMLGDGVNTYGYNALNQLTTVTGPQSATYTYNGDGNRVTAALYGGATTNFYWDGSQISLETNAAGQMVARNVYGFGRIARILGPGSSAYQPAGNNRGYFVYDAHGDVKAITDPTGAVIGTYDYDPWGKVNAQTGTFDNPYRYGGEYQDAASGLYYLRARFYSPDLARFTTEDTYGGDASDPLSLNRYTYVQNSPLAFVDPSGHLPQACQDDPLAKMMAGFASAAFNFIPGVGEAKGAFEAVLGVDVFTGQHLSWQQRLLGLVPFVGGVAREVSAEMGLARLAGEAGEGYSLARSARNFIQDEGGFIRPDRLTAGYQAESRGMNLQLFAQTAEETELADGTFTKAVSPSGRTTYIRNDIEWDLVRPVKIKGRVQMMSNSEAAARGYAPMRMTEDGKFEGIQLHHANQDFEGAFIELWSSTHAKVPHKMVGPGESWRNIPGLEEQYNAERVMYWKWRSTNY